jgi:hypothetical protein
MYACWDMVDSSKKDSGRQQMGSFRKFTVLELDRSLAKIVRSLQFAVLELKAITFVRIWKSVVEAYKSNCRTCWGSAQAKGLAEMEKMFAGRRCLNCDFWDWDDWDDYWLPAGGLTCHLRRREALCEGASDGIHSTGRMLLSEPFLCRPLRGWDLFLFYTFPTASPEVVSVCLPPPAIQCRG